MSGVKVSKSSESVHYIYCNLNGISGPFFLIGDCHGCGDELIALLVKLGFYVDGLGRIWVREGSKSSGSTLVFLGDYCDRGPKTAQVLHILLRAWADGPEVFPVLAKVPGGGVVGSLAGDNLKNCTEQAVDCEAVDVSNLARKANTVEKYISSSQGEEWSQLGSAVGTATRQIVESSQYVQKNLLLDRAGAYNFKASEEDPSWHELVENAKQQGGYSPLVVAHDCCGLEPSQLGNNFLPEVTSEFRRVPILAIRGNHEYRLERAMQGHKVQGLFSGMAASILSLRAAWQGRYHFIGREPVEYPFTYEDLGAFIACLPHYLSLDGGRLVATHGGLAERLQGTDGKEAARFCLFGDAEGRLDANGFPIRRPWEKQYTGSALVIYGHTPVTEVYRCNNTVNIDTGCVFGGSLTAISYPKLEAVQERSRYAYSLRYVL